MFQYEIIKIHLCEGYLKPGKNSHPSRIITTHCSNYPSILSPRGKNILDLSLPVTIHSSTDIINIIETQTNIGWQYFIRGRILKRLTSILSQYYRINKLGK